MKMLMNLFTFVLLFNGCTANKVADALIQKSCKEVPKFTGLVSQWPEFEKDCIASLKENPESQKAKNIDDLTLVGANNAISYLTNVKRIVEKIIKEKKYKSSVSKKALEDCLKLYSKSSHLLISGLNNFKKKKLQEAEDAFRDAGEGPIFCALKFNGDNKQISPVENNLLLTKISIPRLFIMKRDFNSTATINK